MEDKLFSPDFQTNFQNQLPNFDKSFETVEFDDEENFFKWLEKEKSHINWQKRSGKEVVRTHDESHKRPGGRAIYEWIRPYRCPFWGTPRRYCKRANSRTTHTPSRKVGCKATLVARKRLDENKIRIEFDTHHQGHVPNLVDARQRLKKAVRDQGRSRSEDSMSVAVIEESPRQLPQEIEGLAPHEQFNFTDYKEITDLVKNTPRLSTKQSEMLKKIKLQLDAFRETFKERHET